MRAPVALACVLIAGGLIAGAARPTLRRVPVLNSGQAPDGGDAEPADGGDAAGPDGGDAAGPDGGDAAGPDGGDAAGPDGGDAAAADGGDAAAADGGDAAAPDATVDGGDAQVSPLDRESATLLAEWNFIGFSPDAGVSHNPLTKYAGSCSGTNCSVTEPSSPNESGGYLTSGLTYINPVRKDQFLFNGSSGGWGQSSWTGPGAITFPTLVRTIVITPATFATKDIFFSTTTGNAALLKLIVDSTPRFLCQYDDGPGATVQVVQTGISASTLYVLDCYVGTDKKPVLCTNGTCTSPGTAGGATGYTPDTIGIGASNANSAIWDGYILTVQWYGNATWWNTTIAGTDYTLLTAGP